MEEAPRQKLGRAFREATLDAAMRATENTGKPTNLWVNSPLWGRCRLFEHPGDEKPNGVALGYVELEGKPNDFPLAIWIKGEWRTRNDKSFAAPITRWFHLERPDGSRPI